MRSRRDQFLPTVFLCWIALISLVVSGAIFYFLREQAQYDVVLAQRRTLLPVVGIIIAGICIIAGTAGRWFYPK